eukprot:scaffold4104_cov149-Isochrysis_galbana.AAC.2
MLTLKTHALRTVFSLEIHTVAWGRCDAPSVVLVLRVERGRVGVRAASAMGVRPRVAVYDAFSHPNGGETAASTYSFHAIDSHRGLGPMRRAICRVGVERRRVCERNGGERSSVLHTARQAATHRRSTAHGKKSEQT